MVSQSVTPKKNTLAWKHKKRNEKKIKTQSS